jgi:hypothetical protein
LLDGEPALQIPSLFFASSCHPNGRGALSRAANTCGVFLLAPFCLLGEKARAQIEFESTETAPMNTKKQPLATRLRRSIVVAIVAALLVLFALSPAALAQSIPAAERLPADTLFYLQWRGLSLQSDAAKKNHLLQLWEDPDFAAVRVAIAMAFQRSVAAKGNSPSAADIMSFLPLLDNSAIVGFTVPPASSKPSQGSDVASRVASFVVYDATGKDDLIRKLKKIAEVNGKDDAIVRSYDFGGTSVEVRTEKETSYTARAANYFIASNRKEVIEDLIDRYRAGDKPSTSVVQLAEYQAIRPYMDPDAAVSFFGRIPDLNKLIPSDPKSRQIAAVIKNLHIEKIHALGGSASFNGEATRFRYAFLGDTSPGSLFDLVGSSTASFKTQPVVDSGPIFSIYRFDLAALYQSIRGAAAASLPPDKAGSVAMFEGMAQNYLGMPVADALALFTGEIASLTTFAEDGSAQRTFAVTIQKKQDVLRVLRATLAAMIVAEDTSGDTTYLDLSFPYRDSATGQQRRSFYYVAVTPDMVFAAQRKAALRIAIERFGGKSSGAAHDPELVRMRSLLPEKLSALSVADMSRISWDKVLANFDKQLTDAAKQSTDAAKQQAPLSEPQFDWMKLIKPEVLSRHLHGMVSGCWKDSNGVYCDSYLQ